MRKVVRVLINKAKAGDVAAVGLWLRYVIGSAEGLRDPLTVPKINDTKGITSAAAAVLEAFAAGDLDTEVARTAGALIEAAARAVELNDVEERLRALEETI